MRFLCPALLAGTALVTLAVPSARAQNVGAGQALTGLLNTGAAFEDQTTALIGLLQEETTTFPLGSAAGGFTWLFNPDLGVWTRRSNSFGPMFAERPFTNGKGASMSGSPSSTHAGRRSRGSRSRI